MEKEPRKATDVLLALENKVDILLQIVRSQDLNIKLLSNKLNLLMERLEHQPAPSPKIVVEAINDLPISVPAPESKNVNVSSDFSINIENAPQGFRRTSRPETFAGDDAYLNRQEPAKFPMQMPKGLENKTPQVAEVTVPDNAFQEKVIENKKPEKTKDTNSIPVLQRVVDKNGKSIFLADIEIFDLSSKESVYKTRTNGTGKWMSSLPVGNYRVFVRKRDSLSKDKIENFQDIQIDGSESPFNLPTMIFK